MYTSTQGVARILRTAAFAGIMACCALLLTPNRAQADDAPSLSSFAERVTQQVHMLLTSERPVFQEKGIAIVLAFAQSDAPVVDARVFENVLLNLHTDTNQPDAVRMNAVTALVALGNVGAHAPRLVRSLADDPSMRVREHTATLLAQETQG